MGWRVRNPAHAVARRLGIAPARLGLTASGGNAPQALVHHSALAIARGDLDVVLVAGAEAFFTPPGGPTSRDHPPWEVEADDVPAPDEFGTDRRPTTDFELSRGIRLPIQAYPLFEDGCGARRGGRWRSTGPHRRALGRVQRGGGDQPLRLDPHGASGRGGHRGRTATTAWSPSPTPSSARPTSRSTRAPPTSAARWRPHGRPGCPRTGGCSPWPGPTPTTTGSSPSGPSSTARRPSDWPGAGRWPWPEWVPTTWRRSTSTRASPPWSAWPPESSGSTPTTRRGPSP